MTTRARTTWLHWTAAIGLSLAATNVVAQLATCTITATPMHFGVYEPMSPAPLGPVTSTIDVGCSVPPGSGNVTGFTLNLSLSRGAATSYAQRQMTGVAMRDPIGYNIYTTANATSIWGDGTGGSFTVAVTIPKMTPGQSGRVSAIAYGFIPPLQDVAADDYSDTIVVTANW